VRSAATAPAICEATVHAAAQEMEQMPDLLVAPQRPRVP